MKISQTFPSNWLKADDIGAGRRVKCQIARVVLENIGGEDKPIMYFQGKKKGMVLNKTNAGVLAIVYGDENGTGRDLYYCPQCWVERWIP